MSDLDTARTLDAEIVKVIIPQKSDSPKEPQSMTSANVEAQELLKKQPINDEHNNQMKDVIIIGDDWI